MAKVIFAMGVNGEFGNNGALPWDHVKEDMKYFAEYTKDCSLLMGRNTLASLPENGLKGRELMCITSGERESVDTGGRPDTFVWENSYDIPAEIPLIESMVRLYYRDLIVIGGPALILDSLSVVDEVSISIIHKASGEFDCDVRMDYKNLNLKLKASFEKVSMSHTKVEWHSKVIGVTNEIWRRK